MEYLMIFLLVSPSLMMGANCQTDFNTNDNFNSFTTSENLSDGYDTLTTIPIEINDSSPTEQTPSSTEYYWTQFNEEIKSTSDINDSEITTAYPYPYDTVLKGVKDYLTADGQKKTDLIKEDIKTQVDKALLANHKPPTFYMENDDVLTVLHENGRRFHINYLDELGYEHIPVENKEIKKEERTKVRSAKETIQTAVVEKDHEHGSKQSIRLAQKTKGRTLKPLISISVEKITGHPMKSTTEITPEDIQTTVLKDNVPDSTDQTNSTEKPRESPKIILLNEVVKELKEMQEEHRKLKNTVEDNLKNGKQNTSYAMDKILNDTLVKNQNTLQNRLQSNQKDLGSFLNSNLKLQKDDLINVINQKLLEQKIAVEHVVDTKLQEQRNNSEAHIDDVIRINGRKSNITFEEKLRQQRKELSRILGKLMKNNIIRVNGEINRNFQINQNETDRILIKELDHYNNRSERYFNNIISKQNKTLFIILEHLEDYVRKNKMLLDQSSRITHEEVKTIIQNLIKKIKDEITAIIDHWLETSGKNTADLMGNKINEEVTDILNMLNKLQPEKQKSEKIKKRIRNDDFEETTITPVITTPQMKSIPEQDILDAREMLKILLEIIEMLKCSNDTVENKKYPESSSNTTSTNCSSTTSTTTENITMSTTPKDNQIVMVKPNINITQDKSKKVNNLRKIMEMRSPSVNLQSRKEIPVETYKEMGITDPGVTDLMELYNKMVIDKMEQSSKKGKIIRLIDGESKTKKDFRNKNTSAEVNNDYNAMQTKLPSHGMISFKDYLKFYTQTLADKIDHPQKLMDYSTFVKSQKRIERKIPFGSQYESNFYNRIYKTLKAQEKYSPSQSRSPKYQRMFFLKSIPQTKNEEPYYPNPSVISKGSFVVNVNGNPIITIDNKNGNTQNILIGANKDIIESFKTSKVLLNATSITTLYKEPNTTEKIQTVNVSSEKPWVKPKDDYIVINKIIKMKKKKTTTMTSTTAKSIPE